LSWSAGSNRMIAGFLSVHDNIKEDRLWAFHDAAASGVTCTQQGFSGYVNDYDNVARFECGTNQALNGVYSVHDNHKEDRRWKFECCALSSNVYLQKGGWSNWQNNLDAQLDFGCGETSVVVGWNSYHDNHHEDRRFEFKCAELLTVR